MFCIISHRSLDIKRSQRHRVKNKDTRYEPLLTSRLVKVTRKIGISFPQHPLMLLKGQYLLDV